MGHSTFNIKPFWAALILLRDGAFFCVDKKAAIAPPVVRDCLKVFPEFPVVYLVPIFSP